MSDTQPNPPTGHDQTPTVEDLKEAILNQGSLPKRKQLIENLVELVEMNGYKRGFKEAEALYRPSATRHDHTGQESKLKEKTTMNDEAQKEFDELVKPLIKFMAQEVHPHHTLIITSTSAELLEGQRIVVTNEYLLD